MPADPVWQGLVRGDPGPAARRLGAGPAARFVSSAASFTMLFLTLYLTGPRGMSTATAGLLAGTVGVGFLVGNFTGGRWGDRFGHRRVLLTASSTGGLMLAVVPLVPLWVLVGLLPVQAYLMATGSVSSGALSALAVPRGQRRTSVAVGRAASNAGFVLGPPLGALLVTWSYDAMFVVDGLAVIVVRLALSRVLPRDAPDIATARAPGHGLLRALRLDRPLVVLLVGVVLVDLVYRQLYSTLPLHLRDSGQPVWLYATVIAVGSALILVLEIPVTQWLQGREAYGVIALGYALVGVGTAMFALPVSIASVVLAMVVLTAGEILYKTTATAHVLDQAPDHLVGQYQGLYTGAATSGTLISAPIGTAVYAVAPDLLWALMAALALVAAAFVLVARRVSG
ncbi:MFS transporter [Nocardioides glacieisoli]|uniref:MFS transporter n=1 Tax=Nocardioides glacieisoli TaxID=1168730 RepID=A0A4Q2RXC7_9ACTN|nr:MFS transporter [Nocardioides glacieisoli]RYB92625.1 MFS transporter [Nocardioides glacieisoli]